MNRQQYTSKLEKLLNARHHQQQRESLVATEKKLVQAKKQPSPKTP